MFSRSAEAVIPLEVLVARSGVASGDDLEQLAVRRLARVARVARERHGRARRARDVLERRSRTCGARSRKRDQPGCQRRRVLDRPEVGRVREEPIRVG